MADTPEGQDKGGKGVAGQVTKLSDEVFGLAKETARDKGDREARHERAMAINARLRELLPAVESLPEPRRAEVSRSLADAQVDVMYVLSDGRAPASLRLNSSGAAEEAEG
jgi:hypothetical protein